MIKILLFCSLSTDVQLHSDYDRSCSVWSTRSCFWRFRRVWRRRPGSYSPAMDGRITCAMTPLHLPCLFPSNACGTVRADCRPSVAVCLRAARSMLCSFKVLPRLCSSSSPAAPPVLLGFYPGCEDVGPFLAKVMPKFFVNFGMTLLKKGHMGYLYCVHISQWCYLYCVMHALFLFCLFF